MEGACGKVHKADKEGDWIPQFPLQVPTSYSYLLIGSTSSRFTAFLSYAIMETKCYLQTFGEICPT